MDHISLTSTNSFQHPLVGVITNNLQIKHLLNQNPHDILLALALASNQTNLTLYFFSIKDVDLKRKIIKGTYLNQEDGVWRSKSFSYPDIIYRKGASGIEKDKLREFERELKRRQVKQLNYQLGFNKWDVYNSLSNYEKLQPHIPKTVKYQTPNDLLNMLTAFDKIYLKACRGGQGKQVMRIIKLPTGGFEYSYFNNQLYIFKVKNYNALVDKVLSFFSTKNVIVQEAIDLITFENSIIDIRAEVQRNGEGKIVIAGIPVRLGRSNSPITTHASSFSFERFFTEYMKYTKEEIVALKDKLISLLTTIYECIEDVNGPSGEIGIDIGLDKSGRFWFIECNSLSKKISLLNSYDEDTISASFVNLMEYAKYLYDQDKPTV